MPWQSIKAWGADSEKAMDARIDKFHNLTELGGVATEAVATGAGRVLHIGRGSAKIAGAIAMDANPRADAGVIHDYDDLPYPFADNQFNEVLAFELIEHVRDPMAVMAELHRITRPRGVVKVVTPHWTNPDCASDLTYRNHISSYSFRNLTEDRAAFPFYTEVRFKQRIARVTLPALWKYLGFEFFINLDGRFPSLRFFRQIWEHYLNA
ncbi:MAG TPA: methyltransferase domain-containing protein, partial [Blastocatellia bacterium]|nr:methyltransferase domain-containing protein [Blastocatellia bacterium]